MSLSFSEKAKELHREMNGNLVSFIGLSVKLLDLLSG